MINVLEKYYDYVGPGWKPILKVLGAEIRRLLEKCETKSEVKVLQVKEKFGLLRIYTSHKGLPLDISDRIFDLIDFAELMSAKICEHCGKPAIDPRPSSHLMWIKTLCEECHNEREEEWAERRAKRISNESGV